MSPVLLHARALRVAAGARVLVDALDLCVRAGERWCVLGPNGAGKTRLIETLAGIHAPHHGDLRYGDEPLARLPARAAARRRALLPQHAQDVFDATVFELACSARHPYLQAGGWESAHDHQVVLAALSEFALGGLAQRAVHTLSGGERQRLALATVVAQQAPLMLLDEPLNHLDLRQQHQVLSTLARLSAPLGGGLVCSLHDLTLAHEFATHVVLLDGCGGHRSGTRDEVMTRTHLEQAFGVALAGLQHQGRWHWLPLRP